MNGPSKLTWLRACAVSALALSLANGKPTEGEAKAEPQQQSRPVLAPAASYEPVSSKRTLVGVVRARIESDLGFRVQGKVAKRLVSVGDTVHQGEPLATLDEVDLRLQVDQAEAERTAANAALAQAEADFNRADRLTKGGWTTVSTLDSRRAAMEEAKGRVIRAERALELAQNSFSYAVLRADADGVITATSVEPGQVVQPGFAAIRLARTAEKEAVVAVPEAFVERIRSAKAEVSLWSQADAHYAAVLRELSPAADAATRTYLAKFSIPNAGPEVKLGMTATVTLTDPSPEKIVRLPLSALVDQGKGPFVWVVDTGGKLVMRPVAIGSYENKDVLVTSGLAEGERVVLIGAQKLDAGLAVRAVDKFSF